MTYVVTVDVRVPEGTPEMDPLQRVGAVALIEDGFDSVEAIEGPDGMEVDLLDSIVAVHPGGALLKVLVDAPALEFAEEAVRSVMGELLERSELLADWQIERCEVELHPELAREGLAAADGPDAPPDDPADRKARHAECPTAEDEGEGYDAEAIAGPDGEQPRLSGDGALVRGPIVAMSDSAVLVNLDIAGGTRGVRKVSSHCCCTSRLHWPPWLARFPTAPVLWGPPIHEGTYSGPF